MFSLLRSFKDGSTLRKSNYYDETIHEKLIEAELEMKNTTKRYDINEIINSMDNIINKE